MPLPASASTKAILCHYAISEPHSGRPRMQASCVTLGATRDRWISIERGFSNVSIHDVLVSYDENSSIKAQEDNPSDVLVPVVGAPGPRWTPCTRWMP